MAKDGDIASQRISVGCCGAYCKTCRPFKEGYCKGCKLGYKDGKRNIKDAKCKMKVCCFKKNIETCADCFDYPECKIILEFHSKNGFKYKKYEQSIEFIRQNGYAEFLRMASRWDYAYGSLDRCPG